MKTLLLAGIAALFLATGAAHADVIDYNCNGYPIRLHSAGKRTWFTYIYEVNPIKERKLPSRLFNSGPRGGVYFLGSKCGAGEPPQ